MKKGAFAVQANWIFILIAGALILTFFVTVISKQKASSDISIDASIKTKLNSIMGSAEQTTRTVFSVNIPKIDLQFDCQGFKVGRLNPFSLGIAFSPSELTTPRRELILMSVDWNMPYKVTNFLYVTIPEVRYLVIDDGTHADYAEKLYYDRTKASLPKNITKELVSNLDSISNQNNFHERLIFFDVNDVAVPSNLMGMKDKEVSAVLIEPLGSSLDSYGRVTFYKKEGNNFVSQGSSYYLGLASLLGAVYTDDLEYYNCYMQKAIQRLDVVSAVYERKSADISSVTVSGTDCNFVDRAQISQIRSIVSSMDFETATIGDIVGIYSHAFKGTNSVQGINKALQVKSCPLIY